MAKHTLDTLDDLRSEGTLDSEASFTLDPVARDRKTGIDAKKRRQIERQRINDLLKDGKFDDLSAEDQALAIQFNDWYSTQIGWRWGLFAGIVVFGLWYLYSITIRPLEVLTFYDHSISRLWLDPVCVALYVMLSIWTGRTVGLVFNKDKDCYDFFFEGPVNISWICLFLFDAFKDDISMYTILFVLMTLHSLSWFIIVSLYCGGNIIRNAIRWSINKSTDTLVAVNRKFWDFMFMKGA